MKKTTHLFENGIYHVGNHSVALNGMFVSSEMQKYFLDKIEHYLSPICKVLAYDLSDDSFQLVVRLRERAAFEQHFYSKERKKKAKEQGIDQVPDSTYLFSQAMANLQVSFVKHYNHRFDRSGALMASRFSRTLIENEADLQIWIEKLNNGKKSHQYAKRWIHKMKTSDMVVNSGWLYGAVEGVVERVHEIYLCADDLYLGGYFDNLPPKALSSTKHYFTRKYNLLFGP